MNFDIPCCGKNCTRRHRLDLSSVNVIDVGTLFKKREERDPGGGGQVLLRS